MPHSALISFCAPAAAVLLDIDSLGKAESTLLGSRWPSSLALPFALLTRLSCLQSCEEFLPLFRPALELHLYCHHGRARLSIESGRKGNLQLSEPYRREYGIHPYDRDALHKAACEALALYWMTYGNPAEHAGFRDFVFRQPMIEEIDCCRLIIAPVPGPNHHATLNVRQNIIHRLSEFLTAAKLDRFYEALPVRDETIEIVRRGITPAASATDLSGIAQREKGRTGNVVFYSNGPQSEVLESMLHLRRLKVVLSYGGDSSLRHPSICDRHLPCEEFLEALDELGT